MKRGAVIFLQVMSLGVALAGGYLAGTGGFSQLVQESGAVGNVKLVRRESSKTEDIATLPWAERKTALLKRWKASPLASTDFELLEESRQILERAPVADLEAWFRELPSDCDDEADVRPDLRRFILDELAPRAGSDLVKSLALHPLKEDGMEDAEEALYEWLEKDPATAITWLEKGDVPAPLKEEIEGGRREAIAYLGWKDPSAFEKQLAVLKEEDRLSVLGRFASKAASDPKQREVVLQKISTASPTEARELRSSFLNAVGQENWRLGLVTLASLKMPAEERSEIDLDITVNAARIGQFFGPRPEQTEIMQGWLDRNPGDVLPEKFLEVTSVWSRRDEKEYGSWMETQPIGKRRDILASQFIRDNVVYGNPALLEKRFGLIQDETLKADLRKEMDAARKEKMETEARERVRLEQEAKERAR